MRAAATAPPGGFQARLQPREFGQRAPPGDVVNERCEEGNQMANLAPRLDLRRHEAGIAQDTVRGTQLLGHEPVILEHERPPRAGKIIKHALRDRRLDSRLRQGIEQQ